MIGILGYGRFGQLMARYLSEDFPVYVYRRRDMPLTAGWEKRIRFVSMEEACSHDTVILSVPISAMKDTLVKISPLLNPDALVVDVCSVKVLPIQWMRELLPPTVSILATHPMFGPDSAADSLKDRKIVLCRERLDDAAYRKINGYLKNRGLSVIETTAEEHDRQISVSLALTHFIGRSLSAFGATELPIDTEGYKRLLHILGVVENDTWQLFEDMNAYNPYAAEARQKFMKSMAGIDGKLAP